MSDYETVMVTVMVTVIVTEMVTWDYDECPLGLRRGKLLW